MAYSEKLAGRIRQRLEDLPDVEEKEMMGGLTFMVNGKMCVGIIKDELMCRIDPSLHEASVEKQGCRTMDFTKRPMKGYVMVDDSGMAKKPTLNTGSDWHSILTNWPKRRKSRNPKSEIPASAMPAGEWVKRIKDVNCCYQ